MNRIIFHIDVNSRISELERTEAFEGGSHKCGHPYHSRHYRRDRETRHGIVLAKSIPAKKIYGIRTAEPVASALKKCPSLTIIPPDHKLYSALQPQTDAVSPVPHRQDRTGEH